MAEKSAQSRVASRPGRCDGGDVKILIAPDSYGTTMSAQEAAEVIAESWRKISPEDQLRTVALSDGGPGFLDVLASDGDTFELIVVRDPKGEPVPVRVLFSQETAYIESAEIVGRGKYPESSDLVRTGSSYGVGEALEFVLQRVNLQRANRERAQLETVKRVVIGLGGTAINDGGAGLLAALGATADVSLTDGGSALLGITRLDLAAAVEKIGSVEIVLATDVDNPLTGPQGATEMYGPQKGATPEDVRELEGALVEYEVALVAASAPGVAPGVALGAGSGAAGGLGAALLALGATRRSGIEEVARHVDLPSSVAWADLVVTGEGSFDWQSLRGKVVSGVAFHATRLGKPTIVLAGQVHCGRREYTSIGIESAYAMAETPEQVAESMARPHQALAALAERVSRTWSA